MSTKLSSTATSNPIDLSVKSFVSPPDLPFLITGGNDRRIRVWDYKNVEDSYVMSGLDIDETVPRYSSHIYGDISFNIEYTPSHSFSTSSSNSPARSLSSRHNIIYHQHHAHRPRKSGSGSTSSSSASTGVMSSPASFTHLDGITDILMTQVPYPMLISSSRDGIIKVWK
ncbi:phosphoinositide-3-kinase, regulatory subunit 4 [Quaeritorhiza haematococci]|nr:phosphoinositide-3-kinase, regulatory subunit 4 [Quaeritorhiza haematococci]